MKKNEGITLIALIITIIILIILTAVTINNVIGTDLIGFASKAAENYTDAEKEEESLMNDIINEMDIRKAKKLSELVTAENYGDKVKYPVDLDNNASTADWEIFYKDDSRKNIYNSK